MSESPVKWKKAPKWAKFAAMDSDGGWHWYETEPYISQDVIWDCEGRYDCIDTKYINAIESPLIFANGWKRSLQKKQMLDTKYCCVHSCNYELFEKEVNNRLSNGWKLHGDTKIQATDKEHLYSQAMIKEDK